MGLTERATRTDGRLLPIAGDTVYMTTRGPFGSAASVSGTVYESRGKVGGLRVKITGASSFFGGGYRGPKSVLLDDRWTVVDDPAPKRAAEAAAKERDERDAAIRRELDERDAAIAHAFAEAIASGKTVITHTNATVGMRVFNYDLEAEGTISEIAGDELYITMDGDSHAGYAGYSPKLTLVEETSAAAA